VLAIRRNISLTFLVTQGPFLGVSHEEKPAHEVICKLFPTYSGQNEGPRGKFKNSKVTFS
jgi:hypothetical protein